MRTGHRAPGTSRSTGHRAPGTSRNTGQRSPPGAPLVVLQVASRAHRATLCAIRHPADGVIRPLSTRISGPSHPPPPRYTGLTAQVPWQLILNTSRGSGVARHVSRLTRVTPTHPSAVTKDGATHTTTMAYIGLMFRLTVAGVPRTMAPWFGRGGGYTTGREARADLPTPRLWCCAW